MKRFAVIGNPIAQSLSPALHREISRQIGEEAVYEKVHVLPNQLSNFMIKNEFDGFNVTLPHKTAVIPFLNKLDKPAEIIGAVNLVSGGIGYNTDWIGFTEAMEFNNIDLTEKNCVILGAGGAARAVAFALIKKKVKSISILNRTEENAEILVQWIKTQSDIPAASSLHGRLNASKPENIIINCTPVGMWPDDDALPMDIIDISKTQVLVDTIYNPLETKWLKQGKLKGTKTVSGLDMFIAQGLASADIFYGENISGKVDIELIRKILTAIL